jgi:hypothetical protein
VTTRGTFPLAVRPRCRLTSVVNGPSTSDLSSGSREEQLRVLLAVCLVPIILTAVAGYQVYRTRTYATTPWKGGGFGMFSTIDFPPARVHRVYLVLGELSIPVALDGRFDESMRLLRNIPQPEVLANVARVLTEFRWVYPADRYTTPAPELTAQSGTDLQVLGHGEDVPFGFRMLPYEAIRLEVWRYTFESKSAKAGLKLISEATAAREYIQGASR